MKIVFGISVTLLLLIIGHVIRLQQFSGDALVAAGRAQRVSERTLRAKRGALLAANGQALAISVLAPTVTANPKLVIDAKGTASALARILELTPKQEASLRTQFEQKKDSFVYVARQVDQDVADMVVALDLKGVDVYSEPKRNYPSGTLAGSVLGRTDPDGVGTAGMEMQYQQLLAGIDGDQVRMHDQRGKTIAGGSVTTSPIPGDDIVLGLDPVLQYEVETALVARVFELAARGGTVVVMDTDTGVIKAIANVRRNSKGQVVPTMANVAAVESQAPGSVAKAFSIAAAIDQGAVTPKTTFDVPMYWIFDKDTKWQRTIRDAEGHPRSMSVQQIVTKSSNIGTMFVADRIGPEVLNGYHRLFGFGEKTAINFPGETRGALKDWRKLQGSEKATVAYGYGLAVSSLQLVSAMNALANGGLYIAPSLVTATVDRLGRVEPSPAPAVRRVVSPETAATMAMLLTDVVCNGTAAKAQIDGMSVAGKTGTAYKLQSNGTYAMNDGTTRSYFSSFVGYFPAQDPQLTILVSIDEPDANSDDRFGGTAAAPLFAKVAVSAINALDVHPVPGDTGCPAKKRK